MNEIGLYNKHRPADFSEVVGQDTAVFLLSTQLEQGTLPHALLFYGMPGTGKTTCARIVAKCLNPSPCGLVEKDSGLEGKVENIRGLTTEIAHAPLEGDYKTYLFDEAHRITPQAFDSLLKTIEEPPEHVKFIFVTSELSHIPATIRSRCQLHQFHPISSSQIFCRLQTVCKREGIEIPEKLLKLVVLAAGGSLRDALGHLQTVFAAIRANRDEIGVAGLLGLVGDAKVFHFLATYFSGNPVKLFEALKPFYDPSVEPFKAVASMQQYAMDLRIYLENPNLLPSLTSDLSLMTNTFKNKFKAELPPSGILKNAVSKLDILIQSSFTLEQDLRKSNNIELVYRKFYIGLLAAL